MVARLRSRKSEDSRRKEHGLIVWVRDQEADPLVLESGQLRRCEGAEANIQCRRDGHNQGPHEQRFHIHGGGSCNNSIFGYFQVNARGWPVSKTERGGLVECFGRGCGVACVGRP